MPLSQLIKDAPSEVQREFDEARALVNSDAELQSLLYDLDLLPEQINSPKDAFKFGVVCNLWQKKIRASN